MARSRCMRKSWRAIALASAVALAAPAAHALEIILVYSEDVRPAYDRNGTAMMRMARAAADYWEGIILDDHTLTITLHYGEGSGGSSGPWTIAGNRPVTSGIRVGSEETWYFDPTPFDNSEYNMTNWRYKELTATEQADYFSGSIPANLDVGQHGWVADGAPAAASNADMMHVLLHEIGHVLGIPWGPNSGAAFTDGDYDLPPSLLNGRVAAAKCPINGEGEFNTGHLADLHTLMQPWYAAGERKLPSAVDVLAGASNSGWTQIDLPRKMFIGNAGQTSWNNPAYWPGNRVPDSGDHVDIDDGRLVIITGNAAANQIDVWDGGELHIAARLTVGQGISIPDGAPDGTRLAVLPGGDLTAQLLRNSAGAIAINGGTANVDAVHIGNTLDCTNGLLLARELRIGSGGIAHVDDTAAITAETILAVGGPDYGEVRQNAGSVAAPVTLSIADHAGSRGVYMQGGGILVSGRAYVGRMGEGTFDQYGGDHQASGELILGSSAGAVGIYRLGGPATLSAPMVTVGDQGRGEFIQSGGTNTVGVLLHVGKTNQTPNSRYELGGGTLKASTVVFDDADYKQLKGQAILSGNFTLNTGALDMRGGTLSANALYAGASGVAQVFHLLGTINIANEVNVGSASGSAAWLQEGGALAARDLNVGGTGATFTITGGTATLSDELRVGAYGTSLARVFLNETASLSAATARIGDVSHGTVEQGRGTFDVSGTLSLGCATARMGTYKLMDGSASAGTVYVGDVGTGTYTQSGGTLAVGGDFILTRTSSSSGTAIVNGGTLDVRHGRLLIGQARSAALTIGGGTTIADRLIAANGSTFPKGAAGAVLRINAAEGMPTGYAFDGELQVGHSGGSGAGSLILPGGTSVFGALDVGYDAPGTFNQPAYAPVVISQSLTLGEEATGNGTFSQEGADLWADGMYVGRRGKGTFNHRGGNTQAGFGLYIGRDGVSEGTYNLGPVGGIPSVRAYETQVGGRGTGVFNHDAGTHTVDSILTLGYFAGSSGTYNLRGGSLVAPTIRVSTGGAAQFNWTGGTLSTNNITLKPGGTMAVGQDWTYAGQLNAFGGTLDMTSRELTLNGGELELTDGAVQVSRLRLRDATMVHSGGTHSASTAIQIGDAGVTSIYLFSGGLISTPALYIGGAGRLDYSGGTLNASTVTVSKGGMMNAANGWNLNGTLRVEGGLMSLPSRETLQVGTAMGAGTAIITSGSLDTGRLAVGSMFSGTVNLGGGTLSAGEVELGMPSRSTGLLDISGGMLSISTAALSPTFTIGGQGSGTLQLNLGDSSRGAISQAGDTAPVNLVIRADAAGEGLLQGSGMVMLDGLLTNNGRVVADGIRRDRTLDLSSFRAVANTIDNAAGNGWFAQSRGRLALPPAAFPSGTTVANWGEDPADLSIDLVNSARIALTKGSPGEISLALLAPDHSAVPIGTTGRIVGVWEALPSLKFASANIMFRYDDGRASDLRINESNLRLYQFAGSGWVDVTSTLDTATHRIDAIGLKALGYFAVGDGIGIGNQWKMETGGTWNASAHWTAGAIPNGTGAVANLLGMPITPAQLTLDSATTAGALNFRSQLPYTISGPRTLTLQGLLAYPAEVNVQQGNHTIAASIALESHLNIDIAAQQSLTFTGEIASSSARILSKSGSGQLTIAGMQSYAAGSRLHALEGTTIFQSDPAPGGGGSLEVIVGDGASPAVLRMESSQHLGVVRLNSSASAELMAGGRLLLDVQQLNLPGAPGAWLARLDLADNGMVVRSGKLADVIDQVRSARNATPAWSGMGIGTSTPDPLYGIGVMLNDDGTGVRLVDRFLGESVDAGNILVSYTHMGDANLDHLVDGDDYYQLDHGFLAGGDTWHSGDFDYNSLVDARDYFLADRSFLAQSGGALAGTPVPEPAALLLLPAALLALRRRG